MSDIKQYEPLWGAWHVDSFIGEGSYGKVYKVRREEFGKTYYSAVKIISIPQSNADVRAIQGEGMDEASSRSYFHAFVADIVQEIDLMNEFRGNSNIVSFEDHKVIEKTGEIGWDILIRMELLTSLSDYVMDHPPTQAEIIKIGVDICRALELCARKKTIHRDIKPDNIFVSQYGHFKLGDFGIARQIERTVSGLSKKGTFTFMAPEVFKGDEYGANVDMYSLGIVLYRLLNHNRTPFLPDFPAVIRPSDRDKALQLRMSGEPLPQIKGVDPALNAIILKACDYNRKARFASPTIMREALEAVASDGSFVNVHIPIQSASERDRVASNNDNQRDEYVNQSQSAVIADDMMNATEGVYTISPNVPSDTPYEKSLRRNTPDSVLGKRSSITNNNGIKKTDLLHKIMRIAFIPAGLFLLVAIIFIFMQFYKNANTIVDNDIPLSPGSETNASSIIITTENPEPTSEIVQTTIEATLTETKTSTNVKATTITTTTTTAETTTLGTSSTTRTESIAGTSSTVTTIAATSTVTTTTAPTNESTIAVATSTKELNHTTSQTTIPVTTTNTTKMTTKAATTTKSKATTTIATTTKPTTIRQTTKASNTTSTTTRPTTKATTTTNTTTKPTTVLPAQSEPEIDYEVY